MLVHQDHIFVVASFHKGDIEVVDLNSNKTVKPDLHLKGKPFRLSVQNNQCIFLNKEDQTYLPISLKKLKSIVNEKPVKLTSYKFSSCFSSLTKAISVKKTTKCGETKTKIYGIGN